MKFILLAVLTSNIFINMANTQTGNQKEGVETHQTKEVENKVTELQGIRKEILHLMNTSKDYGAFESIDVTTLKCFSLVNGDSENDLEDAFRVPALQSKLTREEQVRNKIITKRIHFIRHGEGYHNVAQREWRQKSDYTPGTEPYTIDNDPKYTYIDALLTPKGEEQAVSLQNYVVQNCGSCTMLVMSPMRRATQTGLLAFTKEIDAFRNIKKVPLKIVAKEEAHERSNPHTCDKRLDVNDLKKFFYQTEATQYGDILDKAGLKIDYSEISSESDPYWGNGLVREEQLSVAKRGCKLMKWIFEMEDMEITIAAHSGILMAIFETVVKNKSQTTTWFATGEVKSCDVTFNLI